MSRALVATPEMFADRAPVGPALLAWARRMPLPRRWLATPRSVARLFVAFAALVVAAIWIAFGAFMLQELAERRAAARAELTAAEGSMRADLQRNVGAAQSLLAAVDLWLAEAAPVDAGRAHRGLAEQIERLRSVDPERPAIRLFDREGWQLQPDGLRTAIWQGDQEFLVAVAAQNEGALHIGVPIRRPEDGKAVLPIAYRPHANQLGIAAMTVEIGLARFADAYADALIGTPPVYGAVRMDGTLLFRMQGEVGGFGRWVDPQALARLRQGGTQGGSKSAVTEQDLFGEGARITAFAFLDDYPLAVFASIDPAALDARSSRGLGPLVLFPAAASLLVILLSAVIARLLARAAREAERVRRALAEAEAANAAKGQFIAKISHELRTPLNAIIGFSEMIGGGYLGPLSPAYRQYGSDIQKSGEHLLGMINQMLEIAHLEDGGTALAPEEVALRPLIHEIIDGLKQTPEGGRVSFALAPTGRGLALYADRWMVRQMLLNLLSNAAKFNRARGEVMIAVGRGEGDGIEIVVADTGIGMTKSMLAQALEPFGRGNAYVARPADGLGLGLPITKSLVELHGGRLDLASKPGAGTVVRLRFPADRARRSNPMAAE